MDLPATCSVSYPGLGKSDRGFWVKGVFESGPLQSSRSLRSSSAAREESAEESAIGGSADRGTLLGCASPNKVLYCLSLWLIGISSSAEPKKTFQCGDVCKRGLRLGHGDVSIHKVGTRPPMAHGRHPIHSTCGHVGKVTRFLMESQSSLFISPNSGLWGKRKNISL